MYDKSLFIFRRDIRLFDNTALNEAIKNSKKVIICFIFDNRQIQNNDYFSKKAFSFLIDSLIEIDNELKKCGSKIHFFSGVSEEIIEKIINDLKINAIFLNKDYTPFSINRDYYIKKICNQKNILFNSYFDLLLNEPELIKTNEGKPYKVFTSFYKKASTFFINKPNYNLFNDLKISLDNILDYKDKTSIKKCEKFIENISKKLYHNKISFSDDLIIDKMIFNFNLQNIDKKIINSGRENVIILLNNLKKLSNYDFERNFPILDKTSHLSSHLKFGTISVREVYYTIFELLGSHPLIRQLYWRDFFTYIAYFFPKVFGSSFYEKYDNIKWDNDDKKFELWKKGITGFPIVDAGMRELNQTGYMHNRLRMITASFLVKNLHLDWRLGEKYFAEKLIDYDPCVNNGNWQWAASVGCDAVPYFRIFNPWLQQKKYDVNCLYIKKWIFELKNVSAKEIHNLYKFNLEIKNYSKPIIKHDEEVKKTKMYYKMVN
jgi:deoxyribodipyrimidine photo-lyase